MWGYGSVGDLAEDLFPSHTPTLPYAHTKNVHTSIRPHLQTTKTAMPVLRWIGLPLVFAAVLLAAGCDDTGFDPFQESDFNYSIAGFLDGGLDTQFVRVTPVRDSIALAPGALDATVTLEHLASGQKTIWKDSVFSFQAAGEPTPNIAHNFWSDEPLEPLATYRMAVTRSDGAMSWATVTLPDTFPDPIIEGSIIKMRGIERLADVVLTYRIQELIGGKIVTKTTSYLPSVFPMGDQWWVRIDIGADQNEVSLRFFGAPTQILSLKVTVAAAGPDWPDLVAIDDQTLALPNVVSNVEEGIGFLGGIISKTFFWPGFGGDMGR